MKKVFLAVLVVFSTLLVWLPFWLKIQLPFWGLDFSGGMMTLWKNFDGANYLIVERTWYNHALIRSEFSNPLPVEYYAAHLPVYPAIIWIFDRFLSGPVAMLMATLMGSVFCFGMFWRYMKEVGIKNSWWLSLVFLILPFRFLAVRSIGSPEPWFLFFVMWSLLAFRKRKYFMAGLAGLLATLTKSPGVILAVAFGIEIVSEWRAKKKIGAAMMTPLIMLTALPILAGLYWLRTGDALAYLHSGDNIHLFWPPFSIFSPKGQYWVGNFWLEDVLWIWMFFGFGVWKLKEMRLRVEYFFSGLFFMSTLFVAHRDIARYILPIVPFVIMGWEKVLVRKEAKVILALLLIPTLLYTWNFLLNNTAPIADWAPYL